MRSLKFTWGVFQNGGYAEKVLVPDEKYLVDIGNLDFDSVSSLACSGLTSFTAIKNAAVSPKQTLIIAGIGGLGFNGRTNSKSFDESKHNSS